MPMETSVSIGWGVLLPREEGRRVERALADDDAARLAEHRERAGFWPPPPELPDDDIAVLCGVGFTYSHVVLAVEKTVTRLPWGRDYWNVPVDILKLGAEPVTDLSRQAMRRVAVIARVCGITTDEPRWWAACEFG